MQVDYPNGIVSLSDRSPSTPCLPVARLRAVGPTPLPVLREPPTLSHLYSQHFPTPSKLPWYYQISHYPAA